MCFYYDEPAELYKDKYVKANKEHKCYECKGRILKNDIYQKIFMVFQGDTFDIKVCPQCDKYRKRIHEIEMGHGCNESESWVPLGELNEYLEAYDLV